MFCPNCSGDLKLPPPPSCPNCGALFGEGSAWTPVASPSLGVGQATALGFARSGLALLLIFIGVGFLSLALASKGGRAGGTVALLLAAIAGASGFVLVVAKGPRARRAATVAAALILAVFVLVIGLALAGWSV
jgi:hypothetical protein